MEERVSNDLSNTQIDMGEKLSREAPVYDHKGGFPSCLCPVFFPSYISMEAFGKTHRANC